MSTAENAKRKLREFRVKELNECLEKLGLRRAGRKQELLDRLIHAVEEASALAASSGSSSRLDTVVQHIDKAYNQMMRETGRGLVAAVAAHAAAAHPAPAPPPAIPGVAHHGQPHQHNAALSSNASSPGRHVRCVCGLDTDRGEVVQCQHCRVYQHANCVGLPVLAPSQKRGPHWCERCRFERSDPFWQVAPELGYVLQPIRLINTGKTGVVGTKVESVQGLERPFNLTQTQWDNFRKRPDKYRLQLCCLQLGDTVTFRYHWPTMCELKVNGSQYRVYSRAANAKMGANQRDEPANVGVLCMPPGKVNKMSITCTDNGSYMVALLLVKSRSASEVKSLMKQPESLAEATARVRRELGYGKGDDDDDLQVTHTIQTLRCPLSGSRIRTPARFTDVPGLSCFDLDSFLSMVEKSKRWQCPHSMRNSSVYNLQIDTYMVTLLSSLEGFPDMIEVEVAPDARWRPSGGGGGAGTWYDVSQKPMIIKPEPGLANGHTLGDSDDESEDEFEELRKAAAAVKRGRPEPEVIELLDSDDEEANRPRKKHAGSSGGGAGPSGVHHANGNGTAAAPVAGQARPLPIPMLAPRAGSGGGAAPAAAAAAAAQPVSPPRPAGGEGGSMRFRINVPQAVAAAYANGTAAGLSPAAQPPALPTWPPSAAAAAPAFGGAQGMGVTLVTGPNGPTISVNPIQPARQIHNPQAHRAPYNTSGAQGTQAGGSGAHVVHSGHAVVPPAAATRPAGQAQPAAAAVRAPGGYKPPGAAVRAAQQQAQQAQGRPAARAAEPIVIEIDSD